MAGFGDSTLGAMTCMQTFPGSSLSAYTFSFVINCFFLYSRVFCLGFSFRIGVLGLGFRKLGLTIQQRGSLGGRAPPQLSADW